MACLEQACDRCDAAWVSNDPYATCPKCGCADISSVFDEEPDYDDRDYDDYGEEAAA